MPDNSKREKVSLLILANPERPWHELCIEAGYSKKRARVTASELRRDAAFQAKLAAIRGKPLAAAPTLETYHALLNSASEAALRGDPNAWILLQCAQAHGKEVLVQEPKAEQSRAVLVKFVESELPPEQVQTVNKFLGQFEAQAGLPPGWSGRLTPAEVTQPETPRPVEQKGKVKPAKEEDGCWFRCERHGKFWNVASCPSCDAISWQDRAYRAAVN